jgi:hypothetical protein
MNRFEVMELVMNILNICEECEVRKRGCKIPCAPVLKQFEEFELRQQAGEP